MHPKQNREIARNPKAFMQFQVTGKLPQMITPTSPLITLLELYTPRQRLAMMDVRLCPELGYATCIRFNNAEQLYRWLKPDSQMLATEYWLAESRRIKTFYRVLAEADLKAVCTKWYE